MNPTHKPLSRDRAARRKFPAVSFLILAGFVFLAASLPADAAFYYIVNYTGGGNNPFADSTDSSTHGGTGTAASPFVMASLRGAVSAANANPGSTITLPAGTYTLTI